MSRLRVWAGLLIACFLFGVPSADGQDRPELILQNGHTAPVNSVVYSPNGTTLASASQDSTVKLWEVSTGHLLLSFEGHASPVVSLAYSPGGEILASGSEDSLVKIWDAATGELLKTLEGHASSINSVVFSPDGEVLASGSADNTVSFWEVESGKLLETLEGHSDDVKSVAYSPDGERVASGSADSLVKVWDAATGRLLRTLEGDTASVNTVVFSPDGESLASGRSNETIKIWDVETGRLLKNLKGHAESVRTVAYSPDGESLASGGDSTVKIWEVGTGLLLRTLKDHTSSVLSVSYSPDGDFLASGSGDSQVKVWDAATGKLRRTLESHTSSLYSVSYSPDGRILAAGSGDNTVKLWEVATGKLLQILDGHTSFVYSVAYSPDGETLASGSVDNTVKLWEVATGRLLSTLEGHTSSVYSVAYSPDGKTLASGSRGAILKVWEVETGKLLRTLEGHTSSVLSVMYSPDGETLASGSADSTVKLWEVATGKLLRVFEGHTSFVYSVAYSPDGEALASGSGDSTVKVWDVATGESLQTLAGHASSVLSLVYSPDGETLSSGGADGALKIWDVTSGNILRVLLGHASSIYSVVFSPDGDFLASGSGDTSLRFWSAISGEVLTTSYAFDAEYLTFAPEGFYSASEGGETFAAWRVAHEVYGFEQYAEQFRRPELVAQRLAGRYVEIPGGIQLAVDRPPTLRWVERFTETTSDEVLVVLSYEGTFPLEDLIVFFNGEEIDLEADGQEKIEIHLRELEQKNLLNAVAFDEKRLKSDSIRVAFDYVGAPKDSTVEIAFAGELPSEFFEAREIQINQKAVRVVDVDPEKKTFKLLGDPGLFERGTNWISSLDDRWRFWWQDRKLHRMPNPYERSYAILVAIDDYDRLKDPKRSPTQLDPLGKMVEGAQKLKKTLMRLGFPGGHITTLYDKDATSERIHQELERFWTGGDRAGADRLVVYFGGHGQGTDGRGSLVTYDYDSASPARTSFLMSDFVSRHFAHADVHHLLVALDACSSGLAIPGINTLDNVDEERLKKFRQLSVVLGDTEKRARNLLLAGTEDEPALYDEGGVFTKALIDGLEGQADWNGDGVIQFGELSLHIKNQVNEIARTAGVKQRPSYYRGTDFGLGEVLFLTP